MSKQPRPTEAAENLFKGANLAASAAVDWYFTAYTTAGDKFTDPRFAADLEMAKAMRSMAFGLQELSIGLRATYILLEEVKRSLPPRAP